MKNEKILLTLKIRKRHLLLLIVLVVGGILVYSNYFVQYMTLPQTAAVLIEDAKLNVQQKKLLVVAPHCDDETLGQGGVIKRATDQGSEVKVAIVTDCNKHKIGNIREQESLSALSVLGVKSGIQFWNFPEGREHKEAETKSLKEKLEGLLISYKPDYIFVPDQKDTHEDHRWIGQTFGQIDLSLRPKGKTYYYLIHYNFLKYPSPPGLKPDSFLTPPIKLIATHNTWEKLMLTTAEEDAKEEAVLKYKSQLKVTNPVLNRVLLDFVRRNELFMVEND
jgi:LmbE family N-acetylglucosaminyl deacetylase